VDLPWQALRWNDEALEPVVTVVGAAALFLVAYYALAPSRFQRSMKARGSTEEHAQATGVLLSRVCRGVLLGVGSVALAAGLDIGPNAIGIGPVDVPMTLALVGAVLIVLLPILYLSAKKPAVLAVYPEIRAAVQPLALRRQSWLAWAVYLFGYELLFRGFLLFVLVAHWGVWPALAVSTGLYALAHLDKLPDETAATIPMGIVFGGMAILTGGVWAPWLLHTLIACITEALATRNHRSITTQV
jgi:membrane protease YdiL (CAAX protease family)